MKKLAIVTTHPIQYNAPWFKLLSERALVDVRVFYTWSQLANGEKYDPDFKKNVAWDIPLLEGYSYQFIENTSTQPGSHHFKGIKNPTLNSQILAWQADCILIIGWSHHSHLNCLRYFKNKVPLLFRGDSNLIDEKTGLKKIARRLFLSWVYSHIDKALFVGKANFEYYKKHGLKSKQLVQARHAIDNERFSEINQGLLSQGRAQFASVGIQENDFVVLFVGKLEEKKNPAFIIHLAGKIHDPQIKFLIVGSGGLEEALKQQAKNCPQVKFLPFQNQAIMPSIYQLSNALCLPSKGPGETWGLAMNEAMAAGLPVLGSTKAGGSIDLIKDNGIIFQPEAVNEVKDYILTLKNSPKKYTDAQTASLSHIKNFTFTQIAEAVELACNC